MKKALTRTIIIMAMMMALAIAAVPVSASEGFVSVDITKNGKAVDNVSVWQGKSTNLGYKYAGTEDKPTWKSSNTSVATVKTSASGWVTVNAKKKGTATITAELDGEEDSCTITVKTSEKFVNANGCYSKLNKYRKGGHKKALKKDKKLEKIAKIRAKEMAQTGKFSHTRPNGKSGLTLIKGNKYKGENIAMGQTSCDQVSAAWFKSPGHKKNMMKKQYKKVGIAAYEYNGVIYWAQVFSS